MVNAYVPITSPPRLLDAAAINTMFGKPRGWLERDRTRKALYARGFPQPVIRGRWLRTAVEAWLERMGNRTNLRQSGTDRQQGAPRARLQFEDRT